MQKIVKIIVVIFFKKKHNEILDMKSFYNNEKKNSLLDGCMLFVKKIIQLKIEKK